MTTRREFVKSAGVAMAGMVGFPAAALARTPPAVAHVGTSPGGGDATGLATNGYLSSILPVADRAARREINVRLTQLAIDQCTAGGGARNQVEFGTLICRSLAEFAVHDVSPSPTAFCGSPELELGSQLTTPPDLGYVNAYWRSPTHDFVPFLLGVKNKYDPTDVFKSVQSIPLAL